MFKERLEALIAQVLEQFGSNIAVSNFHQEAKHTAITVYLISNATASSFGDSLPPIIFDQLDTGRATKTSHIGYANTSPIYLAEPPKG